jgi:hypothetical protein
MKSSPVGRPRSNGRRDLPDNLIPRPRKSGGRAVTYWYYRDPRDGKEKSLKCTDDRTTAIRRANELNAIIARERADQVVNKIITPATPQQTNSTPFNAFAVHCLTLAKARGLADNTMRCRKSHTNAISRWFGDQPTATISIADINKLLKHYTDQGKHRTAKAIRSLLCDIFDEAPRDGVLPVDHGNPARMTRDISAKVNRARLTLETFNEILKKSESLNNTRGTWIANSLLLALITGQRREDIAIAQFRKGRDWQPAWEAFQLKNKHPIHPYPFIEDDHFWVVQQKTRALVSIPLSLKLDAIGLSVGDVIERCRSDIATRHIIHHTIPFGQAPIGSPAHKDSISRAFKEARNLTDLEWIGKTPPTYHELRSLSERLYSAQGINTKALLGHKKASTTAMYNDARQAEWGIVQL